MIFIFGFSQSFAQNNRREVEDSTKIKAALEVIDLNFTQDEIKQMARGVRSNKSSYNAIREFGAENSLSPSIIFNPLPYGFIVPENTPVHDWKTVEGSKDQIFNADLAFMSIPQLAYFIKSKTISCVDLTKFYLERLKSFEDTLKCVVTLTEELALQTAAKLDAELADGKYRGPLHGIPYGVKDLMAVKGYPTTWGAMPYKDQIIDKNAAVVEKLEEAGAVLLAKLTTGAIAMGDVWFGGTTRNPWNLEKGSSGSSAGPASATSAGLVAFAIGTETLGSIISPSNRCGVTGLRPTYGTVSKYGTMALSWTMDKIGPICRNAIDCAIVMDYIRGADSRDPSSIDAGFYYSPVSNLSGLRIGYLEEYFSKDNSDNKNDAKSLDLLRKLGADLQAVSLPDNIPVNALRIILSAEAAAAFDELTLSDRDSLLVSQGGWAWPNSFRTSRLIPAVEYIQANRIRTHLIQLMDDLFKDYDIIVSPTYAGSQLTMTNLTGHPAILIPNGFDKKSNPTSFSLLGPLFSEGRLCAVAELIQSYLPDHSKRPPLFNKESL